MALLHNPTPEQINLLVHAMQVQQLKDLLHEEFGTSHTASPPQSAVTWVLGLAQNSAPHSVPQFFPDRVRSSAVSLVGSQAHSVVAMQLRKLPTPPKT